MRWYVKAIKNYANFNGRARRKEYWMFRLFSVLFAILVGILDFPLFSSAHTNESFRLFSLLFALFSFLPSIAVTIRRLHDLDKSGGWYFISFIPLIGPILMLVLMCTEGTTGPNQYGEDPKTEIIE